MESFLKNKFYSFTLCQFDIRFLFLKNTIKKENLSITSSKEIKDMFDGDYVEVEVYKPLSTGRYYPNGDYTEDMEVGLHELVDEEDYNQSLLAGCDITADFEDWYGDRNAKILCIMIK